MKEELILMELKYYEKMIKKILNYFRKRNSKKIIKCAGTWMSDGNEGLIKKDGVLSYPVPVKAKLTAEIEVSHGDMSQVLKNGNPTRFKFTYE